jgi:hypothetical protein
MRLQSETLNVQIQSDAEELDENDVNRQSIFDVRERCCERIMESTRRRSGCCGYIAGHNEN